MKFQLELLEDFSGDGCTGEVEFGSLIDDVSYQKLR
jgi:hypothetical protein